MEHFESTAASTSNSFEGRTARQQSETSVDVIIPVHNAPDLTRRCIDSIYTHISEHLGKVLVLDDASDRTTRELLDSLDYPDLEVIHSDDNVGFGATVNRGFAAVPSSRVLVLNSDVEARDDFLAPLNDALDRDRSLAAVAAAGNTFAGYRLGHCQRIQGVIPTFALRAFAFLIRREAFEEVGGFDPAYGLGYFEDSDLCRKLTARGWSFGVVPTSELHHEVGGSFKLRPERAELYARNREIYASRYPNSLRRILFVGDSAEAAFGSFEKAARQVLVEGGSIAWVGDEPVADLPAIEVRARQFSLLWAARALIRKRKRAPQRYSELWLCKKAWLGSTLLACIARVLGIPVRRTS